MEKKLLTFSTFQLISTMLNRPPLNKQDRQARLIGIFLMAVLLFNFPLLGIFDKGEKWGAVPALFLYILIAWVVLILLVFLVMRDIPGPSGRRDKTNGPI